jgi:integrase
MATTTGLFRRNGHFYVRVLLPLHHPLRLTGKSRIVKSLGTSSPNEAKVRALETRLKVLQNLDTAVHWEALRPTIAVSAPKTHPIREIFEKWKQSHPRSNDSINSCDRSLKLFEALVGNISVEQVDRAMGAQFKTHLLSLDTTHKTARDRLIWVKSLLNYAHRDLELTNRNVWNGIDISFKTTKRRRPWTEEELITLFSQPLFREKKLPRNKKSGGWAAYWVPLIAVFSGARVSEICQLSVHDIDTTTNQPIIRIRSGSQEQRLKTVNAERDIPIHPRLLQLGLLEYVQQIQSSQAINSLWPDLPKRNERSGGYFSQWFGEYLKTLQLNGEVDFHSFRHTVRTQLALRNVSEIAIDRLLGHSHIGSIGSRTYTHIDVMLPKIVASICYEFMSN